MEILATHPQAQPPKLISSCVPCPTKISDHFVIKALRSFPLDTTPGTSILRTNHLIKMFCLSQKCISTALISLCKMVNLLCSGKVLFEVAPQLFGA